MRARFQVTVLGRRGVPLPWAAKVWRNGRSAFGYGTSQRRAVRNAKRSWHRRRGWDRS